MRSLKRFSANLTMLALGKTAQMVYKSPRRQRRGHLGDGRSRAKPWLSTRGLLSYLPKKALGDSLTAELWTLTPPVEVRILVPQPDEIMDLRLERFFLSRF